MRIVFNPLTAKFDYVLAPAEILAGLLTVDGAGSLLDADLLDGQHAVAFQPVDATLTTLSALADGAGVLTNNGAGVLSWAAVSAGDLYEGGTGGVVGQVAEWVTDDKHLQAANLIAPANLLTLVAGASYTLTIPASLTPAGLAIANVFTTQQMVDGSSDQIQLRVQANAAQTANIQTWEKSDTTVTAGVDAGGRLFSYGNAAVTSNVLIGTDAGVSTMSGGDNQILGNANCGDTLTSGYRNFIAGSYAADRATTLNSSVIIGYEAASLIQTGSGDFALGYGALYGSASNRTGVTGNIAIGTQALNKPDTNTQYVVAIGSQSQFNGAGTRTYTTTIGSYSGYELTTGSYDIFIGAYAGYNQTTNSNLLIIDNTQRASTAVEQTNAIIYGTMAATPASQILRLNANVKIVSDAEKMYFGGGEDMSVYYDGTAGNIDTDLVAASDLTIDCGTAKTLVLEVPVYNDANVGSLVLVTGGTLPGVVELLESDGGASGIYMRGFAVNEQGSGSIEIPHDYKEGTDIVFHVHWVGQDAPSGTDNVRWQITYSVTRDEVVTPATTTVTAAADTPFDTQYEWKRTDVATITGAAFKIGDQFNFTLTRITASGDAYAGEALVATLGFHYQCDTLGSRQIGTK